MTPRARHEPAASLSGDRAEYRDVALSATHQRDQYHGAHPAPGPRGDAGAVWISAAAHPAGPRRSGGESQTRAPDLSGGRVAGAAAAAEAAHARRARPAFHRRVSGSSAGRWTLRPTRWPTVATSGRSISWTTSRGSAWLSKSTARSRAFVSRACSIACKPQSACRRRSSSTTGQSLPAARSTRGRMPVASRCASSDRASRSRTCTSRASTGSFATSV